MSTQENGRASPSAVRGPARCSQRWPARQPSAVASVPRATSACECSISNSLSCAISSRSATDAAE